MAQSKLVSKYRRQRRIRKTVSGTACRPRMCIFKSAKNIYVQIIDDTIGATISSASSRDKDLSQSITHGGNIKAATIVGQKIAEKAKSKNIIKVVFDRSGYKYHGCVRALADAARETGLEF